MLDLALAPKLSKVDLGVVYQALRHTTSITALRATDALLTPGGVAGVLALTKACTFLQVGGVGAGGAQGAAAILLRGNWGLARSTWFNR